MTENQVPKMDAPRMDPTIKHAWIQALRSGEYKQGKGVLFDETNNTYCCFGVLCALAVGAGLRITLEHETMFQDTAATRTLVHFDGDMYYPTEKVFRWAGVTDERVFNKIKVPHRDHDKFLRGEKEERSLASLNDDGYTFNYIANLIEDQL